jgi:hypothetical protein
MESQDQTIIEPEVMTEAIEKASPRIPITIEELAVIPDERGVVIIETRSSTACAGHQS